MWHQSASGQAQSTLSQPWLTTTGSTVFNRVSDGQSYGQRWGERRSTGVQPPQGPPVNHCQKPTVNAPSSSSGKNKGLIAETYDWDEEQGQTVTKKKLEVFITGSNKPKLSKAKDSTLSNHDTGKHPLPPLEKLTGAEPVFGLTTIKSILKSKSTFKAKTLKEEESNLETPQHVTKNCETCGSNVHTVSDHNEIEWFRKREALQAKKVKSFKARPDLNGKAVNESQYKGKALQIKNHTLKRDIEFHFIPTQYQLADIFIKPLYKLSFKRLIDELGMLNIDSKPEASVSTEEN
ncbi:hypothetical protein Tco_0149621 [Tanacetum coccineum]